MLWFVEQNKKDIFNNCEKKIIKYPAQKTAQ